MKVRNWIDIEPGNHSLSVYEVSKKVIHLLRHSQQVQREEDGAVHFWRIEENLQKHLPYCPHWSDDKWKKSMAGGGGNKKRYQYCTDSSVHFWRINNIFRVNSHKFLIGLTIDGKHAWQQEEEQK